MKLILWALEGSKKSVHVFQTQLLWFEQVPVLSFAWVIKSHTPNFWSLYKNSCITLVRNDEKKSYSLFKFWAELAVYGCAQKWADSYSTVNFDNGFWLIQKSDCSKNKLKNPRILWSNLFVIGVLVYNQLLKPEFFSLFTSLCIDHTFPKCYPRSL